jgi:hypothetical protein
MKRSLLELQGYSRRDLITLIEYSNINQGKGFGNSIYRLSKKQLIDIIRDKSLEFNKLLKLKSYFAKNKYGGPEKILSVIFDTFNGSESNPIAGSYFTFRYIAKTPNIWYDQHPLIACVSVDNWGFSGVNFHLSRFRNYTWSELRSPLYKLKTEEFNYLKTLPYAKLLYSRQQ